MKLFVATFNNEAQVLMPRRGRTEKTEDHESAVIKAHSLPNFLQQLGQIMRQRREIKLSVKKSYTSLSSLMLSRLTTNCAGNLRAQLVSCLL
jgi:hypothetical protein